MGVTRWFADEHDLDAVTAVSGSGPAYFFYLMEAMIDSAQSLGLSAEAAQELVTQTALGAAAMATSKALIQLRFGPRSRPPTAQHTLRVNS